MHRLAKKVLGQQTLATGRIIPRHLAMSCRPADAFPLWMEFINNSIIRKEQDFVGTHFAGYVLENSEWCLPSWIWTNAALVRMYCSMGDLQKAKDLGEQLAERQQECGGWIVRNDYDKNGAIPVLAPNDSAYIANNAFLTLYEATNEDCYLTIAKRCADWIIDTARPDSLVYTGFNTRDNKWDKNCVIVDTGFTAGLFVHLVEITGNKKYSDFLERFVKRYIDLFYLSEKKGFCTSIDKNDIPQGGMFARGQAWALEGLIPAYKVIKDELIKEVIDNTVETLLKEQLRNGGWSYNLTRKLMGEDCKAISVIAKDMMDWYAYTKDRRILESAKRALDWCCKHTAIEGEAKGGIFSYCVEGAIVKDLYTSCAFVYASAYAIELRKQIENAENYTH